MCYEKGIRLYATAAERPCPTRIIKYRLLLLTLRVFDNHENNVIVRKEERTDSMEKKIEGKEVNSEILHE